MPPGLAGILLPHEGKVLDVSRLAGLGEDRERGEQHLALGGGVSHVSEGTPEGVLDGGDPGIPIRRWKGQIMLRVTVGIPASSILRATSPTDRQQSGQTGARSARSTSSLRIAAAISGALWFSRVLVSLP